MAAPCTKTALGDGPLTIPQKHPGFIRESIAPTHLRGEYRSASSAVKAMTAAQPKVQRRTIVAAGKTTQRPAIAVPITTGTPVHKLCKTAKKTLLLMAPAEGHGFSYTVATRMRQ